MIKLVALDIDGVLTDGLLKLDQDGKEYKSLCYHDIDAISRARRNGIIIALVTGEDTPMVDVIAKKLDVDFVYKNAKDKLYSLQKLADENGFILEEIAYIGDSVRDVPALKMINSSFAPSNAEKKALAAARYKLKKKGGDGAVNEALKILTGDLRKL